MLSLNAGFCGETHTNKNKELYVSTSFATISISCENRVLFVSTPGHAFFSCIQYCVYHVTIICITFYYHNFSNTALRDCPRRYLYNMLLSNRRIM